MSNAYITELASNRIHTQTQLRLLCAAILAISVHSVSLAGNVILNGSFEQPSHSTTSVNLLDATLVPGWQTTASDGKVELWSQGFQGVSAHSGVQHAELNANHVSTLFQDVSGIPANATVGFSFAHRGRLGPDTLELRISDLGTDNLAGGTGSAADTILYNQQYTSPSGAWSHYSASNIGNAALGNAVRFEFESVAASGGVQTIGNFLDSVGFGVGVPEPASVSLASMILCAIIGTRRR